MPDGTTEPAAIAARYGLSPLPVEGGLFRETWAGPVDSTGRPCGTAITMLLADADFSALHRLPTDEIWHFYRGDPLEILLLEPDGADRVIPFGSPDHAPQLVIPAGTWMGARVAPGGRWSLFGTTMAPGFRPEDYVGGERADLLARYPAQAARIRALTRPDAPLTM